MSSKKYEKIESKLVYTEISKIKMETPSFLMNIIQLPEKIVYKNKDDNIIYFFRIILLIKMTDPLSIEEYTSKREERNRINNKINIK